MPSKWLNWQPGDRITENPPHAELTKPTKINSVSFVSSTPATFPIIHNQEQAALEKAPTLVPTKPDLWGVHFDQYGWRLNTAFEVINRPDYTEGMILWLEAAAPYLYDRLTCDLPDRISRAWDEKVPFDEFDRLCCELEETHGRAVSLYRQYVDGLPNVKEITGS